MLKDISTKNQSVLQSKKPPSGILLQLS